MSEWKKAEKFTRLVKHCADRLCMGKCPECGGCTDESYGVWGALFGVARVCLSAVKQESGCDWHEVVPEYEAFS